jgi:hypothetical protein
MSTVLGGITLDNDLVFTNEYEWSKIRSEVTPTLGGGVVVQEFEGIEKGREITLASTDNIGWQQKSTVDALKALADDGVYNSFTLTITSGQTLTKTVRFRHEVEGGPVQAQPLVERDGYHVATMWYKVTIFLMVI